MKESIKQGLTSTRRIIVDPERTIDVMGDALRVYATPSMVRDVERTCLDLVAQHLDEGESSVGARVEIDHLAPTLLDMWVDITVNITEIEGRRVHFDFTVEDAVEPVGRGSHTRFVVQLAKSAERLAAKAAKAAEL